MSHKPVRRQSTLDQETVAQLEKKLGNRPEKGELQEKNILKDDHVAPSLVAKAEELKRAQLEDNLEHKLQQRPKPDELVQKGILQGDEAPGTEN